MNESRRLIESSSPWTLRNAPVRPRDWRALMDAEGAVHLESDGGEMLLVPDQGELRLHWAYEDIEQMRLLFPRHFDAMKQDISADVADYVTMDLIAVVNRDWFDPLLRDADFAVFAEWMDMAHAALDTATVPEFPEGVTMRRATDDDIERLREIWKAAYSDYVDGDRAFDAMVNDAAWAGVLEADGEIAAFALNGEVERAEGRILTAAVAPERWGNGYGKLVLTAAMYQLASKEATRAVLRVRPDIRQALRVCSELGFRHFRSGIEFRRSVDEAAIAAARETRRVGGVKARFGDWR
ncbi:MAG: GNAT family N-acetyltransferase [Chloroflexi bacterium]|nr:GNAT family N-acetyltransferase [Chloroflexota bacterium]